MRFARATRNKAAHGGSDLIHLFVWPKMFSCGQISVHILHISNVLEHGCTFDVLSRTSVILKTSFYKVDI